MGFHFRPQNSILIACTFLSVTGIARSDEPATKTDPALAQFEAPDKLETKGNIDSKTASATTTYGTVSVPHGIYALTPRPECQYTPGWSSNNYSVCATAVVYIPIGAHIDSVVAYARNSGAPDWRACSYPSDCSIGWSAFYPSYQVSSSPVYQTISWRFMNWSHNLGRDGMIAVTWH